MAKNLQSTPSSQGRQGDQPGSKSYQASFTVCASCAGQSQPVSQHCPDCQGLVVFYPWQGRLLFWQKKLDQNSLLKIRVANALSWAINIIILLFALTGLAVLAVHVLNQGIAAVVYLDFWLARDLAMFWLGILFLSFFVYRLTNQLGSRPVLTEQQQAAAAAKGERQVNIADSFDKKVITYLGKAYKIAEKLRHSKILPVHIFAALLASDEVNVIFSRLGVDINILQKKVWSVLSSLPREKYTAISLSKASLDVLLRSYLSAAELSNKQVKTYNLIAALVVSDELIQDLLSDLEIDYPRVLGVIDWIRIDRALHEYLKRFKFFSSLRPKGTMNKAMTAVATPFLDRFSIDLTSRAKYGALDFCVNREKEFKDIFRLIDSGEKSVVLIGEQGVGKSTIIDGIAQRMVLEEVPKFLRDKRLVKLSIPRLVAGKLSAGELEARILKIHKEIVRATNVVLVVENIHDIVGLHKSLDSGLDISEVFTQVVQDNRFLVIATSTPSEYKRLILNRPLGSVLHKVEVSEGDDSFHLQVLESKVGFLEYRYKIYYSYSALEKIIELSSRFLHQSAMPEKAVNILEEVGIYTRDKKGEKSLVGEEEVAEIISQKVHIPLTRITEKESEKLLNLEDLIHQRIIGQDEAVRAVAAALRRARTELRDEKRPIVNLLFLGPTGVGKTELAKTVSSIYFGQEDIVRLDMSEYQTRESLGRLIGSESDPKGGYLTERIKANPFTVLLLDEIEKAHPDILNVFLQVMDDGRLTDYAGETVDFTNTIIIATSNAGSQFIQDAIKQGRSIEAIEEELVKNQLKGIFRPEFLNRFDKIVVFKTLTLDEIEKIAELMFRQSQARLRAKGINLVATPEAIKELAKVGFDPLFGARPMRRAIQERVDDALAKFLLTGRIRRRDTVILDRGGKIYIKKAKIL